MVQILQLQKNEQESKWSQGKVPVTIDISKGYRPNALGSDSVSINVELSGFKIPNTQINSSVGTTGLSAGSSLSGYSPYKISNSLGTDGTNNIKQEVIKFIYVNKNDIFTDLPGSWNNDDTYQNVNLNSGYFEFVDSISTSLTFKFSVKNIYENGFIKY